MFREKDEAILLKTTSFSQHIVPIQSDVQAKEAGARPVVTQTQPRITVPISRKYDIYECDCLTQDITTFDEIEDYYSFCQCCCYLNQVVFALLCFVIVCTSLYLTAVQHFAYFIVPTILFAIQSYNFTKYWKTNIDSFHKYENYQLIDFNTNPFMALVEKSIVNGGKFYKLIAKNYFQFDLKNRLIFYENTQKTSVKNTTTNNHSNNNNNSNKINDNMEAMRLESFLLKSAAMHRPILYFNISKFEFPMYISDITHTDSWIQIASKITISFQSEKYLYPNINNYQNQTTLLIQQPSNRNAIQSSWNSDSPSVIKPLFSQRFYQTNNNQEFCRKCIYLLFNFGPATTMQKWNQFIKYLTKYFGLCFIKHISNIESVNYTINLKQIGLKVEEIEFLIVNWYVREYCLKQEFASLYHFNFLYNNDQTNDFMDAKQTIVQTVFNYVNDPWWLVDSFKDFLIPQDDDSLSA